MKNINKSSLLAFVFFTIAFLTVLVLPAQKLYSLKGQITDAATQLPISKAVIQIPGTKFSDTSNKDGYFAINDLPAGTNTVYISAENYSRKNVSIVIKDDRTLNMTLESIFPKDIPNAIIKEDIEEIPNEEAKTPKKEKKVKEKKEKKPKVKKKSKKELIAAEFARKSVYEKLIENVVAFENLYFSEFELHKRYTSAIGFFSVENKQIYLFEAEFEWNDDVCTLKNIEINLKGVQ